MLKGTLRPSVIAIVDGFRVALPILRLVVVVLFGFVGWVERSETHHLHGVVMGFASSTPYAST